MRIASRAIICRRSTFKPDEEKDEYVLAPPMLPPAAAVLLDLDSQETLVLASMPNYNLENLTPFISQSSYDKIQRKEACSPEPITRAMLLPPLSNW